MRREGERHAEPGRAPGSVGRWRTSRHLVMVAGAALVVLGVSLVAADRTGLSIEEAVSDPHETTRLRLLGVVSNIGVLGWAAAASVTLLGALVGPRRRDDPRRSFFVASTALSLMLLVDDLFLVHEFSDEVAGLLLDFEPTRARKDVLEAAVFSVYAVLFAGYCVRFRAVLLGAPRPSFLVAAVASFALSTLIDLAVHERIGLTLPDYRSAVDVESIAEEGLKLVGIAHYAAFFFDTTRAFVAPGPSEDGTGGPAGA